MAVKIGDKDVVKIVKKGGGEFLPKGDTDKQIADLQNQVSALNSQLSTAQSDVSYYQNKISYIQNVWVSNGYEQMCNQIPGSTTNFSSFSMDDFRQLRNAIYS